MEDYNCNMRLWNWTFKIRFTVHLLWKKTQLKIVFLQSKGTIWVDFPLKTESKERTASKSDTHSSLCTQNPVKTAAAGRETDQNGTKVLIILIMNYQPTITLIKGTAH